MKRFGKKNKEVVLEAEIVVPEKEIDESSDLEKKFEEKGKEIGRKAGKILHDSKVRAGEFKDKMAEKEMTKKVKEKSTNLRDKVKEKVSKK